MKRPLFDELRTLDFILVTNKKIFGWELRGLSADLSPTQKSVVNRFFVRQEKLSEVAAHLGKTEKETQLILDAAIKRLTRRQAHASMSDSQTRNQRALHVCGSCGTPISGRFRQRICHECDPARFKNSGRKP